MKIRVRIIKNMYVIKGRVVSPFTPPTMPRYKQFNIFNNMAEINRTLARVNYVESDKITDNTNIIAGISVGTVIHFKNCKVVEMEFVNTDGQKFKPTDANGNEILRDYFGISCETGNYSLTALRYKSRANRELSTIGKAIKGTTKKAIETSLENKRFECIEVIEEKVRDRNVTAYEWKKVEG